MFSNPDLVLYACIAHKNPSNNDQSSTILAEFNSVDSSLQELAHQCLQFVPPYHTIFTHTFHHQTYSFLLNDGFIFFGIFDSNCIKSDQVCFLTRLKETIGLLINVKTFKFSSFCLQSEFHPIFHKLMSKSFDFDVLNLIPNGIHHHNDHNNTNGLSNSNSNSNSSKSRKIMSMSMISKGLKKKKLSGDSLTNSREPLVDGKVDLNDDDVDEVKSKEINHHHHLIDGGSSGVVGKHKAKKIWRRHVWVVLVMDLVVCLILFGIWLFVCRGLQCIEG